MPTFHPSKLALPDPCLAFGTDVMNLSLHLQVQVHGGLSEQEHATADTHALGEDIGWESGGAKVSLAAERAFMI